MKIRTDAAAAFYDRLTAAAIRGIVNTVQENHLVDFKLVSDCDLTRDDKKNLACMISGFANADGGVIVWGVDARRDPKEDWLDQVTAAPGVEQPKRLLSRLIQLTSECCIPVPSGVEHKLVSARTGQSFVATLVPRSEEGPHMAKLGENRYYTRSGGSTVKMEHFQIADMFGRRPAAVLEVSAVKYNPFEFRIKITNTGRGAARAPYIKFCPPPPFTRNHYGVDGNRNEYLQLMHTEDPQWIMNAAGANFVLHPSTSVLIGGITVGFTPSPQALEQASSVRGMRYQVGALGAQPREGVLALDPG